MLPLSPAQSRFACAAAFSAAAMLARAFAAEIDTPVTLGNVLELTASSNPSLSAARYAERIADAQIEQAGLRPNPTLDVSLENFAGTGAFRGTNGLEGTVQASQAIERGGKRQKRVSAANTQREMALAEFAVQRRVALTDAAVAFLDALLANQRRELATSPVELARKTLAAAEGRIAAAMGSNLEIARAQAAVAAAEIERARRDAESATAVAELASHWGATRPELRLPAVALRIPEILPDRAGLLSRLASHPQVRAALLRVELQRAELDIQEAARTQDISVGAGLRWLRPDDDAALVASVSVPIPIHDRNQGAIRGARERVAQAERMADATELELRTRFSTAWQTLAAAHQAATQLRARVLPIVTETSASLSAAYEQGQVSLTDVLDGQRSLIELRQELLAADFAYAAALVRVEALIDDSFPLTRELLSQP